MNESINKGKNQNVIDLQAARNALLAQQKLEGPQPVIESVPGAGALPSRRPGLRSVKSGIDEIPDGASSVEDRANSAMDEQTAARSHHPTSTGDAVFTGDRVVTSSPGDPGYSERLAEWQTRQDQIADAAAKIGRLPLDSAVQPPSEQQ